MKNVVITGVGIKSCIGNTYEDVLASLQNGTSGIVSNSSYAEMGFRSQISGSMDINFSELIDRKLLRFMGESAAYSYLAAKDAIEMSSLNEEDLDSPRVGIVAGSGGASTRVMVAKFLLAGRVQTSSLFPSRAHGDCCEICGPPGRGPLA